MSYPRGGLSTEDRVFSLRIQLLFHYWVVARAHLCGVRSLIHVGYIWQMTNFGFFLVLTRAKVGDVYPVTQNLRWQAGWQLYVEEPTPTVCSTNSIYLLRKLFHASQHTNVNHLYSILRDFLLDPI